MPHYQHPVVGGVDRGEGSLELVVEAGGCRRGGRAGCGGTLAGQGEGEGPVQGFAQRSQHGLPDGAVEPEPGQQDDVHGGSVHPLTSGRQGLTLAPLARPVVPIHQERP